MFIFVFPCSVFKAGIYVTMMFEVLRTLLVVNILNVKVVYLNDTNTISYKMAQNVS